MKHMICELLAGYRSYPVIISIEWLLLLTARGLSVHGGDLVKLSFKKTTVNDLSIGHNVVRFIDRERGLNGSENQIIIRQQIFISARLASCPPCYYK